MESNISLNVYLVFAVFPPCAHVVLPFYHTACARMGYDAVQIFLCVFKQAEKVWNIKNKIRNLQCGCYSSGDCRFAFHQGTVVYGI